MELNSTLSAKRKKPSTALQAATHLLEVASRIDNVVSELNHIAANHASNDQDVLTMLRKSITPCLELASQGIKESTMLLSPMGGAKALHSRQDAEWKRQVLEESKEKDTRTPQRQYIDAYVTTCYLNNEESWLKRNEKKKKPMPKKTKPPPAPVDIHVSVEETNQQAVDRPSQDVDATTTIYAKVTALQQNPLQLSEDNKSIILPPPQNGTEYSKVELLAILTQCSNRNRAGIIKEMLSTKLIPCGKTKVYELIKLYEENIAKGLLHGGIRCEAWGKIGRPRKGEEQLPPNPRLQPKPKVAKKQNEIKQPKPKPPPEPVVLPYPPSNGSYYSRSDFFQLIKNHTKSKRTNIIKHLITNKLIPIKKTSVYKHLSDYEKDPDQYPMDDDWNTSGRPEAFSDDEAAAVAQHVFNNPGSYDVRAIGSLLLDAKRCRLLEKGQDPDGVPAKLSNSTVRNYFSVIMSKLEMLNAGSRSDKKTKRNALKFENGILMFGNGDDAC